MVRRFPTALVLLGLSGCVLFSVPERASLFDPGNSPERDLSVSAPPLTLTWTASQDADFVSYTVVSALNPVELRDYLRDPSGSLPAGITPLAVITTVTTVTNHPAADPVYPTYYGVIYSTSSGKEGSDVAVWTP